MSLPAKTPLLLIDAAAPRCVVGLWQDGDWLAHASPNAAALEGVFAGVEQILCDAKLSLADLGGFIHNEGPGSILGIRLSAMAIRTWRALPPWRDLPVWTFGQLHFAAAAYAAEHGGPAVNVISEFRQGRWNYLASGAESVVAIDQHQAAELPEPLVYVRQRKNWQPAPAHAIEWSPSWPHCASVLTTPGLLRQVDHPSVVITEEAEFAKWSGERHGRKKEKD